MVGVFAGRRGSRAAHPCGFSASQPRASNVRVRPPGPETKGSGSIGIAWPPFPGVPGQVGARPAPFGTLSPVQNTLHRLVSGLTLTEQDAEAAFDAILRGEANESQVGAMLALIARRGPTLDELIGGARAMRRHALRVPTEGLEALGVVIDTCGTGGSAKTFNVSTAAALVAAGARGRTRVLVAKHGGRSRSGRGSAEVLEQLGVNIHASPAAQRRCLEEAGACFSFAVNHHPAMKFAAAPRKSLGFPTIFNLLGPLTNPAGASRQVMGVYDGERMDMVAMALASLGCDRAMIVRSIDGMDEISTTGPTVIVEMIASRPIVYETSTSRVSKRRRILLDPAEFGVPRASMADLSAPATLDDAANALLRVLQGEPGPRRDIVCVNAAAALVVADAAGDFHEGLALAAEAIDSGRAKAALDTMARISNTEEG